MFEYERTELLIIRNKNNILKLKHFRKMKESENKENSVYKYN